MSKLAGKAYHPGNGSSIDIWEGFSWPCLLLGFFWYAYKGLWGMALIALILAFATFGLSWLVFPFFANAHYAKALVERGYLTEVQWRAQTSVAKPPAAPVAPVSTADELTKLAALRDSGHLSAEEFDQQKARILRSA